MGRTFSMASSKRYRILTKDNGVLTVKFASLDEANKYIKQNNLKGAKAYKLGDIKFSESGESRAYSDIRKDFMIMLKECGFLTVKDKDLLVNGFSPRDLYLKCPKKGFVGTWDAQDSFIITDNDFSSDKTLEIPLNLITKKYQNFMYSDSPKYDSSVKAFEKKLKKFLGELGFHKPSREQLWDGFDPDDMIMEFPKMGFMGTFGADHSFIITNDQRDPRQIEKTIEFEYWELAKDKNISKMFSKVRSFSIGDNIITVDKDPAILKNEDKNPGLQSALNASKPKDTIVNFDNGQPFFMSVEPFITAQVMSDTADGIYVGTIKGSEISAGSKIINMMVKLNEDYPYSVIAIIKGKKVYVWKAEDLVRKDAAKVFSIVDEYNKSKEDTQKSVEETVKEIEKDMSRTFSKEEKEIINKTKERCKKDGKVRWIALDYDNSVSVIDRPGYEDYDVRKPYMTIYPNGTAKKGYYDRDGKAYSEIDSKSYSDIKDDKAFIKACHDMAKAILKDKYDKDVTQNTAEGILRDQDGSYNKKLGIYKNGLRSFSAPQPTEYGFILDKDSLSYDMDHVIGTLLMSVTYAHLFHLIKSSYSTHMALNEYYNEMPESVDRLAEAYLAETNVAKFACCVVPTNDDPIDYLTSIRNYLIEYPKQTAGELKSNFQSLLDDAVNIIEGTLYKLKRLQSGMKSFSDGTKIQRVYGISKAIKDVTTSYLADTAYEIIEDNDLLKEAFKGYQGTNKKDLKNYLDKFKITPLDFLSALGTIAQFGLKKDRS